MAEEQPKIFIDEGWKAQVQKEKEEALQKQPETAPPAAGCAVPGQPPRMRAMHFGSEMGVP